MDTLLETTHLFGDFLVVLVSWPAQILRAWYNGLTFHFPWNYSVADEDLQSVSSDESRPQSRLKQRPQIHTRHRSSTNISTGSAQDSVDGFSANQIWYPPPPAYEEEDHSQVHPLPPPIPSLAPGLYPTTRSPDEWRQYPNFPAAYPLSPVLDPVPPPGFRIVAPVPKRPSDVIDIGNMSNSGQTDGNEPAEIEVRPGFRRSLLSLREFVNPNSAVRLSDETSIHGVQIEDKLKISRRKRKRLSEGGEKGDGGQEDSMNVDGESGGENAADADEEESEDEGYVGDETFTTPKIRTVTVDSDAEMEGTSGFEQGNSFSFQTPVFPRRAGKRTKSNLTIRKPSSTSTLNPRRNAPDVYLNSPPHPFPPHLAPPLSPTQSGSSIWSASTSLSTQGGGDSLLTGDGSEREEIETPLSPGFPSPVTYPAGTTEVIPIPDVDPTLTVSVDIRGKRLFPRTNATNTRNRPPAQGVAISSSSSGGANSRGSSRSRGSRRSQGLQPSARRKNVGVSGLTRPGLRPVAKGAENAPISPPISIQASDPEDVRKRKTTKDASGANRQIETHSDAPFLNKRQKTSSVSLRKTSSMGFKAVPPQKQRLTTSQKIQIARSTSSGTSASSSNLGERKRVSFVRNDKSAVRATRVRSGGAVDANESGV